MRCVIMKIDRHVCFDIETTGLAADDRIVSYCLKSMDEICSMCCDCTEKDMLEQLSVDVENALSGKILVTFNGENWSGGFDIPFLRTRYAILDMLDVFPFRGVKHIDLMPIMQKKFNTSTLKEATFEDLSAAQCKELLQMCNIKPLSTKAINVEMLNIVDYRNLDIVNNYLNANTEQKIVNKYGLKHCYHLLFGGDAGMTGEDVPELWKNGEYDTIAVYNEEDCSMTMRLLEVCLAMVPSYDMRYFVL